MKMSNSIFLAFLTLVSLCGCNNNINTGSSTTDVVKVKIILGSTREERFSEKVARYIEKLLAKRTDIETEIVDLREYKLEFFSDKTPPARRTTAIIDPCIQRWSDTIADADAFIIIVPEYNAGYPGVLKNALDSLYTEWNGKPVGFVGYSGGHTGGTSAVAQLRTVTGGVTGDSPGLKMIPVDSQINIPTVWKAFDDAGNLLDQTVTTSLDTMINQLIKARHTA